MHHGKCKMEHGALDHVCSRWVIIFFKLSFHAFRPDKFPSWNPDWSDCYLTNPSGVMLNNLSEESEVRDPKEKKKGRFLTPLKALKDIWNFGAWLMDQAQCIMQLLLKVICALRVSVSHQRLDCFFCVPDLVNFLVVGYHQEAAQWFSWIDP